MRSLRVRLLVWLCLALCTLWGGVAAWMFAGMRHELRSVLDDRLIASARMVAGIVHQFKPHNASPEDWGPMLNVVARDGVACEVSMIRSEVHTAPAHDAMDSEANAASDEVGGKAARPALIPASPLDVPRAGTVKTDRAGDSAEGFHSHETHVDAFPRENAQRRARGAGDGGVHKQWRCQRGIDADDDAGVPGVGRDDVGAVAQHAIGAAKLAASLNRFSDILRVSRAHHHRRRAADTEARQCGERYIAFDIEPLERKEDAIERIFHNAIITNCS